MSGYTKASFLDEFELPEITHDNVKQNLIKVGRTHEVHKKKSLENMPLEEKLEYIKNEVYKVLGRYRGFVKVITEPQEFVEYIDEAIKKNYLSFDTETDNSLDPLTCKIMGLCMYIPNTQPVYVPINHCKAGTDILLENQISEKLATEQLQRLCDNGTRMVYHNGKFDIRVCKNTLNVNLPIWWDTMIASQLLDENELARLKYQYKIHIDPTIGTYNIEALFKGIPYAWVDPNVFALYASIDAFDTYKLQQWQQSEFEKDGMERLYNLFQNIEIPVVKVTASMEDSGICMDTEFLGKLDKKYKDAMAEAEKTLQDILLPHQNELDYYHSQGKIDSPVNFDSPTQLKIVLYDILKSPKINDDCSTDKATLKAMKIPFTEALLKYRHFSKLVTSFTTPLPDWISKRDGKLHANFNQLGAEENNVRTGRFSSTNPNMQQVPSHGDDMRMMFMASTEYNDVEMTDENCYIVPKTDDVLTPSGWKRVKELSVGDIVCGDGTEDIIKGIKYDDKNYYLLI